MLVKVRKIKLKVISESTIVGCGYDYKTAVAYVFAEEWLTVIWNIFSVNLTSYCLYCSYVR